MADAAISATIQVALETVISLTADRVSLVLGFREELERLCNTAETIRGILADADGKMHIPGVKNWLKQLEGELFEVENVLDKLNYETLHREVKYRNQLKKKVCFFFSYFNTIGSRSGLASKIREINMNLERINRQANDLGLVFRFQIEAALPAAAGATTSRHTDSILVPNVVGRVHDESKIVDMLLSPSEKVLSVIPMTGMGGLGKTTLAKLVYNDPKIDGHFGQKIWVCVAKEQIKIMELFKLILVQLTREEVKVDDRDVIVKKIGEKLKGQRYFLVLDDVWDHEQGLWDDYFNTLMGLNETKGSWCLVTTRLVPVANAVSRPLKMNGGPYFLGKLPDNECWSILKEMVIAGEEVPTELEAIKNQILRKCDGLPLAAKLIGGLLVNKKKEEWKSIMKESHTNEYQSEIDQILKVSFDHLSPASVKKCFAYCSIFPKDTDLKQDLLIELWMAEGFVQPDRQNQRLMEEIGADYLRILLQNSLLEKVEESWRTYYKMHDLVHDFAKSVLNPKSSNQDRYLVLNSYEEMAENVRRNKSASLRTLFLHLESRISADMLSRFKHLHVLKLSGEHVTFLPSSIGELLHLRLLNISYSEITSLPESLCKLYNLQTLTMSDDALEGGFPNQMSNLISLRHLNYNHDDAEFKMPMHMGRLACLQTLMFFNVSQERGCGIEELGTLKYLKGSLEIRNLGLVEGKEAAKQAKLFEKPSLSHLRLDFEWKSGDRKSDNCDEDVLEGLQPHQNLQELEIRYFMGNKFSQWFVNLSKLVELQIEDCERCSELPTVGQLPSLKRLYLKRLDNIRSVGDEFYGITANEEEGEGRSQASGSSTRRRKFFPALEELYVEYMENLVEWKEADQMRSITGEAEADVFPMLRDLSISHCPRLISLGVNGQKCPLSHLERLRLCGCDGLTTIPNKMFESCLSLQSLRVVRCPNLVSLSHNLQETPSLKDLAIVGCPKLILHRLNGSSFATNLRELWIASFSSNDFSMDDFDWSGLISALTLRELELRGLPHSDSLPHQLQYLTTLTSLSLDNFGGIEVLPDWIGNLVSLETLWLWSCQKLQSLPSEATMRRLTKLTRVEVYQCPLLRQRYTPQRGIYLKEEISSDEISSDPTSSDSEQEGNDGAQTSCSCCFPSLLKKES
nr:putative disease resistance protein RGA3 isoform X1 [Coffea arabica]